VEHDPRELLDNVRACIASAGRVDAIGIANQGESCLAWDAVSGAPLSPLIVWQDTRTSGAIERMRAEGLETLTLERARLPLHSYFTASKLAWILQNVPAAADARRQGRLRLGTTDSFFLHHLTGEFATDATTASRTSLMNLASGQWDPELCRMFDIPLECLPEIRSTIDSFGMVDGIPIRASVVDQQASLFGHGCRSRGDTKITFGTGAFVLAITGSEIVCKPESGLLPTVAWRIDGTTTFALDGGVFHAGAAVDWAFRLGLFERVEDLNRFESRTAIERGLVFVPALTGLASPHWDPSAAGLWIGMSSDTTRADLCQSILEGIALRTAEVIAAMDEHLGICDSISIDGGLAASPYFAQFLADVCRRSIERKPIELTAYGCAALAAEGIGALTIPSSSPMHSPRDVPHELWHERFSEAVRRAKRWR
jgi:glycerol kinase